MRSLLCDGACLVGFCGHGPGCLLQILTMPSAATSAAASQNPALRPRPDYLRLLLAGDELLLFLVLSRRSSPCCSSVTWSFGRSSFFAQSDPVWDSWGFFPVRLVISAVDLRSQVTTELPVEMLERNENEPTTRSAPLGCDAAMKMKSLIEN